MDLHAHHMLTRCTYCRTVISQCRCMGPKETVWTVCDGAECKDRFANEPRATNGVPELTRLRAENERLRTVVEAAREYIGPGGQVKIFAQTREELEVAKTAEMFYRRLVAALAALDQERK